MEVGVETNTPPALVPFIPGAEVGADTATPPALVGKAFSSLEPTALSLTAGAETDTPPSFSTMVCRDLPDRRPGCRSFLRRAPL